MKKNFRFMVLLLCIALTAGMLAGCVFPALLIVGLVLMRRLANSVDNPRK